MRRREGRYGAMAREYRTHGAGRASGVAPHTAHRTHNLSIKTDMVFLDEPHFSSTPQVTLSLFSHSHSHSPQATEYPLRSSGAMMSHGLKI